MLPSLHALSTGGVGGKRVVTQFEADRDIVAHWHTIFSQFYELQKRWLTKGKGEEVPNDRRPAMSIKNGAVKALEEVLTRVVARQTQYKQFGQPKSQRMEQGLATQCRKTLKLAELVKALE